MLPPAEQQKALAPVMVLVLTMVLALMGCAPEAQPEKEPDGDGAVMARVEPGTIAVDGTQEGYPEQPLLEEGKLQVFLAHDGSDCFVWAQTAGDGWLSVGFNQPGQGMDGANLILGNVEGEDIVRNDLGQGRSHNEVETSGIKAHMVGTTGGEVALEFQYPLEFPDQGFAVTALEPGSQYSLLVAFHDSSQDATARHQQWFTVDFQVE